MEQHILPLTKPNKSLMLGKVGKERVGPSFKGACVSQARKCRSSDLVKALENHHERCDWDTVFVRVDFTSANQPLLTNSDRNLDPKVTQERFHLLNLGLNEAMKRFDKRLIFSISGMNQHFLGDRDVSGKSTGPFATRSPCKPCLLQENMSHSWRCSWMTPIKSHNTSRTLTLGMRGVSKWKTRPSSQNRLRARWHEGS